MHIDNEQIMAFLWSFGVRMNNSSPEDSQKNRCLFFVNFCSSSMCANFIHLSFYWIRHNVSSCLGMPVNEHDVTDKT